MRVSITTVPPLVAALLVAAHAWARSPTDGMGTPPSGVALGDTLPFARLNPAALGLGEGFTFVYTHERDWLHDGNGTQIGNGLMLSLGLVPLLKLGYSVEWIRPSTGADWRRTSWTLAAGGQTLSLGLNYNLFGSSDRALEALESFDIGAVVRPLSWLSLGASARDVNEPRLGRERLPIRYDLGLGLRPGTDRVELGADYLFAADHPDEEALGFYAGIEPLRGWVISAGATVPLNKGGVLWQVALARRGDYLRAAFAEGWGSKASGFDHLFQVAVSTERARSVPPPGSQAVVVDLAKELEPSTNLRDVISYRPRQPFLDLLAQLERIENEPLIDKVSLRVRSLPIGFAQGEELRNAITRVRASGKMVTAYLEEGGDVEYFVAAAADSMVATPEATLVLNGLALTSLYLGQGLGQLGVAVDVSRTGPFKTAPDTFTRSEMSPEERATLDAYLDTVSLRYERAVAERRRMTPEAYRAILDRAVFTANGARQAGLVDAVAPLDVLPGQRRLPQETALPRPWGTVRRVGLVVVEGAIADGPSRRSPWGGVIAGSESIVGALEMARKDPSTAAVVLRVNSSGGGVAASERIARAVRQLRETKPVVVSMGGTAASGGYYIAAPASRIYAEPQTITGSIGVFSLKPSFEELMKKLGIAAETLKRGAAADLFSPVRRWTPEEQRAMDLYVEETYGDFANLVAKERRLTREQVDAVGRGRTLSGEAAKAGGLVDELGGLREAIESAKHLVKGGSYDTRPLVVERIDGARLEPDLPRSLAVFTRLNEVLGLDASSGPAKALLRLWPSGTLVWLELGDRPLAMLPYTIEVR